MLKQLSHIKIYSDLKAQDTRSKFIQAKIIFNLVPILVALLLPLPLSILIIKFLVFLFCCFLEDRNRPERRSYLKREWQKEEEKQE